MLTRHPPLVGNIVPRATRSRLITVSRILGFECTGFLLRIRGVSRNRTIAARALPRLETFWLCYRTCRLCALTRYCRLVIIDEDIICSVDGLFSSVNMAGVLSSQHLEVECIFWKCITACTGAWCGCSKAGNDLLFGEGAWYEF